LNDSSIDTIFSKLDSVKHIYLAGGEPLIEENNYVLLNKLIERGLKPSLLYNTNLTNIKFKDKNLTDLWQHFPEVEMTVSLDGYGKVNDYIRFGSDYEQIIQNIFTIKERNPHVRFTINSVASIMSMRSIPDLFKDLITRNVCIPRNSWFSICHHPDEFDPTVLPIESKNEIKAQYEEYIAWLTTNYTDPDKSHLPFIIKNIRGLIEYMMSTDNSGQLSYAIEKLEFLDKAREVTDKFKTFLRRATISDNFTSLSYSAQVKNNILIFNSTVKIKIPVDALGNIFEDKLYFNSINKEQIRKELNNKNSDISKFFNAVSNTSVLNDKLNEIDMTANKLILSYSSDSENDNVHDELLREMFPIIQIYYYFYERNKPKTSI
jgi:sulfatase maturation enzyme AslB (radical SAM superfamily)